MPKLLKRIVDGIYQLNRWIGEMMSWAILGMVVVTFAIVILRYFFNTGWVWMQEIVIYLHAFVFLLACGSTLVQDGHVRVDIFYREASPKTKRRIDLLGALFLLLPTCLLIFYQAFPFVMDSWSVLEGSKDGGGLEGVFILKTAILAFCILTFLQALAMAGRFFLGEAMTEGELNG